MVLIVAPEGRRSRRCEKLTPRLPKPPGRTTAGLGCQRELPREERDIDRRLTEAVRYDGVLRFEETRDTAGLRFELRKAWIRRELPVRGVMTTAGRNLRLP